MNQFFSIRKSQKDKKMGTIIENIFDGRLSVSRKSIGYKIPLKLWDAKNEKVKEDEAIDYTLINSRIQMLKDNFNQQSTNRERNDCQTPVLIQEKDICFIEFCRYILVKDYDNISTQNKYTTIVNSVVRFTKEHYQLDRLPIEILRRFDFVYEYAKSLIKQTNGIKDPSAAKKNNTRFNYIIVLKTLVKKFNQHHPHFDTIKTDHYVIQVPKKNLEKIKPKMLYKKEVDMIINYQVPIGKKRAKTLEGKHQFLFQFFTSGLRVSDILLLNYKHFVKGRLEIIVKKNDDFLSPPLNYKSAKLLAYFYPLEFKDAIAKNSLCSINLNVQELDFFIKVHTEKDFRLLTLLDLEILQNQLINDKFEDYTEEILVLNSLIKRVKAMVAYSMCDIMGSKEPGFVFDYLPYEEFKHLKILDKKKLTLKQTKLLDKGRSKYNSKLRRIAKDLGFNNLSSHVSRHSFAFHMLETGSSTEEISCALGHSSIQQTQVYINQFPSYFADNAIKVFEDSFEL